MSKAVEEKQKKWPRKCFVFTTLHLLDLKLDSQSLLTAEMKMSLRGQMQITAVVLSLKQKQETSQHISRKQTLLSTKRTFHRYGKIFYYI